MLASTLCTSSSNWPWTFSLRASASVVLHTPLCPVGVTCYLWNVPLPSLFSLPCFGSITTLVYSCSFSRLHSAPSTLFSCPCCILNLLENECWAPHTAAMALSVLLTVLSPAPGLCQACLGMQGQGAFTPLSACSRSLVTHLCPPPQIILASPTFDSWTYHGLQCVL